MERVASTASDAGVIHRLSDFAMPKLKASLKGVGIIDDDDYDWSLNE